MNITWIKITTDIFDNEKIMFLEQMPEGDTLIVIWFKLLALAGKKNDCGLLYLTRDIPYDDAMLINIIKRPLNIIKLALATFEKLNMIELTDNNYIAISNWERYQNVEGMEKLKLQWREASQKYRKKQKIQLENHNSSYDCHNTEKMREDKIRLDKIKRLMKECYFITKHKYIENKNTDELVSKIIESGYKQEEIKNCLDNYLKYDYWFSEGKKLNSFLANIQECENVPEKIKQEIIKKTIADKNSNYQKL